VNLGDWVDRCRRLAQNLDALGVRYTIGIAVDEKVIASFDSATSPIAAPPAVDGSRNGPSLDGENEELSEGSSEQPATRVVTPGAPAGAETSADQAEDAGSSPAPRSNNRNGTEDPTVIKEEAAGGHTHHWKIDSPNGAKSVGRCWCGETKEFRNSDRDALLDLAPEDRPHAYESGGRGRGALCSICGRGTRHEVHRKSSQPSHAGFKL
jgi:hypothetical protein